jgi:hypothetical protein
MAKGILKLTFCIMNTLNNELFTIMMLIVDGKIACHMMNLYRRPTSHLHDADSRQQIHLSP